MYAQAATRTRTGMFSLPWRVCLPIQTGQARVSSLTSSYPLIQNQKKINLLLVTPKKSEYESEKKRCLEEKLVR